MPSALFSPLRIGAFDLAHRVVMAPLTRMRAEPGTLAPRPLNAAYYAQRATPGGLLIAEASPVLPTGLGNPNVPGIYSEAQIVGWKRVVDAVHAKAASSSCSSGTSAVSRIRRSSPAACCRWRHQPSRSATS